MLKILTIASYLQYIIGLLLLTKTTKNIIITLNKIIYKELYLFYFMKQVHEYGTSVWSN